jgi:peptidoglycan/xylan/chitin deacetylase (PgdA/CDA1 family)
MPDFVNDNVALPEPKNEQTVPLGKEARFIRGQDYNALRDAAGSLRTNLIADRSTHATKTELANETSARVSGDSGARAYIDTQLAGIGAPEANAARITAQETHTSGFVNVRSYGAKCDGVTDDTAEVQALLAALGTTPRTIVVDGPCAVNVNLAIPANQPVRMEGNGAFVGTGVVTYQPWGVLGASAPQVRRLAGDLAIDYATATVSKSTASTAAGAVVTLDSRGASKLTWTSATAGQFVGALADGTWDISTSDRFALDLGFDRAENATYLTIFFSSDTNYTAFANYAHTAIQFQNGANHLPRLTHVVTKASLTTVGAPNWAAIKHVEVRFHRNGASSGPSTVYLHGLFSGVAGRPKVLLTFDDVADTLTGDGFARMSAAGLRGTVYPAAGLTGTAGYHTLAQLKAMYAAGWDVGGHSWRHVRVGALLAVSRSGTVATAVLSSALPHGKIAGDSVTIAGFDEEDYNGTYTVQSAPNAYTFTYNVAGTSLRTTADGYGYLVGLVPATTTRSEVTRTREWLKDNGMPRAADHFAWPYGAWNPEARSVLAEVGILTARGTGASNAGSYVLSTVGGLGAPHNLPAYDLNNTSTAAAALAKVDEAIAGHGTLFFYGHGIRASSPGSTEMLTSEFQAMIDGIKARRDAGQIDVVTISEWFNRL